VKDRQKKILRFMLLNEGMLHIEDIAEAFSVGKRTVSRDLDAIEQWLSFRGAGLERKPNQGIRVMTLGKTTDELLDIVNIPDSYIESLDVVHRQKLILLYLLFNNCEIKISSIANSFYISDTSVWNDLNQIEKGLVGSGLQIDRMKGVGIRLSGPESVIRLRFLSIMTEVFSSNTIIPYLYAIKEDKASFLEINQLKILINRLNFPGNIHSVFHIISSITESLGYQFTMSGEAVLYFYLQLSLHRITSGGLIQNEEKFECMDYFKDLGKQVLKKLLDRVFSGNLPEAENSLLGVILQVLEIGDISAANNDLFEEIISPEIRKFSAEVITEFGRLDKRQYYLNEQIDALLNLTTASLVSRFRYRIPVWHGQWGDSSSESWNEERNLEVLTKLLSSHFGIVADSREIEYLLVSFYSMIFNKKDIPDKKIRVLVCCFEGIGLANYLQSILTREIDTIHVVEATAVFKIRQEYLDAKGIELVISTFPIADLEIPVLHISLPLNREEFIRKIAEAVSNVKRETTPAESRFTEIAVGKQTFSFGEVLGFVNDFRIIQMSGSNDFNKVIAQLSGSLVNTESASSILSEDFRRREASGPLFFDEWGMRVLHCKSAAVKRPLAGVLEFENDSTSRMLFMVAPDPCPNYIRKMLSTITISIMENSAFRTSIQSGNIDLIKKNLMDIYQDLI
jgi:mannitol operon transcriptional antiterminator